MSFLAFIALVYLTRNAFIAAHGSLGVLRPLFVFACSVFCITALAANPPLPLNTFFAFLGRYSFSIYLFHIPYFAILHAAGVSTFGSARGVVITLAFLPLFLLACRLSEDCTNTLRRRVLQVVS
jgi:peptidoglycan/LPS O-acetylase OafA/YrhL